MLTLEFVPYVSIASLDSKARIDKLLEQVKEEKIILLEGRLREVEEAELIRRTMEEITEKFTGIELGVVHPNSNSTLYGKLRRAVAKLLLGQQPGFTIIGPANIIKEIKRDPNKIQLFTKDKKK